MRYKTVRDARLYTTPHSLRTAGFPGALAPPFPIPSHLERMFDTPANFSSSSSAAVGATGGFGSGLPPGVPGAGGTGLNGCRSFPCAKLGGVEGGGVESCASSPSESGKRWAKSSADAFRAVQCVTAPRAGPTESRRRLAGFGFATGGGGRLEVSAEERPGSTERVSYRETREEMAACRLTD